MKVGSRMQRLMSNAGALALGGIVAQAAFVGLEALVARQVGTDAYGIYSSAYVLIMLMAHLMDMGMYWKLVQDGARDPATIRGNLGTMMVTRLLLFAAAYPVFLLVLWLTGEEPAEIRFFALFAFFGVQVGMQELLGSVYTARQRMAMSAVFQAAMPVSILAFTAMLVIPDPTLPRLATAFILGAGVVTAVWTWQTWKRERPQVRLGDMGSILRGCFHYGVSGVVWNGYLRIGVLVLTFVAGFQQVAFFAAALKLIDLLFKIAVLMNRVVAPRLFADSRHNPEDFAKSSEILLRMTVATGAMGSVLLYVAGGWLVELVYGSGFAASGELIRILGISLALKTIALIAQTIISAADDHSYRTKIVTASTAIAIAVAVPLAAQWGAVGVAYAVVAGDVVLLALLMWRVWQTKSVTRLGPVFGVPLLGALICTAGVAYVDAGVIVQGVACVIAFGAMLWLSGYLAPITALMRANASRA